MRDKVLIGALLFFAGVGLGAFFLTPRNIWDYDSGELDSINHSMRNDKSERLAMVILTQEGVYRLNRMAAGNELQIRVVKA
jgi:hypothetical protein